MCGCVPISELHLQVRKLLFSFNQFTCIIAINELLPGVLAKHIMFPNHDISIKCVLQEMVQKVSSEHSTDGIENIMKL